jgi:hypothetical protein
MRRFVLKKLFDIRPIKENGELNLEWILHGKPLIQIKKSPVFNIRKRTKKATKEISSKKKINKTQKINFPSWEKRPEESFSPEYDYEEIRQNILQELDNLDSKETHLKRNFGAPLNLPVEKELKKEQTKISFLKKIFPQTINLKDHLPHLNNFRLVPSLKYVMVGIALIILLPVSFIAFNASQTKDFVITSGSQGYENLSKAQQALLRFQPEKANQNFQQAYNNFNEASGAIHKLGGSLLDIADILPLRYKVSAGRKLLQAGEAVSKAGAYLSQGLTLLDDLEIENIFKSKDQLNSIAEKPNFYLKGFSDQFQLAKEELTLGIQLLDGIEAQDLPSEYQDQFASLKQIVPLAQETVNKFDDYFNFFLSLLGEENPRHYLLLFQNNSELRATGGFIGSYALLKIYKGQIDSLEVNNIFDADGQLIVNIVPPQPIQKISSGWSTHDANWYFDFPTSAEKIAWFYEKTGAPTVDGIIALTPAVIEKILEITGPLHLSNYDLTINHENFVTEVQYKVEKDYDPYQNKPKKILADFTSHLFNKISQIPKEKWANIVLSFKTALQEKDMFLWLKEEEEQSFISQQGWEGSILQAGGDYLAVVHSNINGYKTDRFMKEDVSLDIELKEDGSAIHNLTIHRKHTGGNEAYEWYNKVNSDYIRVYLPKGTKLLKATGNDVEYIAPPLDYEKAGFQTDDLVASIEKTLEKDPKTGLDIFQESNKTVIGGWLYTSPGEETTFNLTYKIPDTCIVQEKVGSPLSFQEEKTKIKYLLSAQKQAGSYDSPLRIRLTYPDNWRINQLYPRDQLISQTPIRFRQIWTQDKFFGIEFSK